MDEWKEDHIRQYYDQKLKAQSNIQNKLTLITKCKIDSHLVQADKIKLKMSNVSLQGIQYEYIQKENEQIDRLKQQLDEELIDLVFGVGDSLINKKQLEELKHQYMGQEQMFAKIIQDQMYEIKRFSAYLAFETSNCVSVKRIDRHNPKFQRCQKALHENAQPDFFSTDSKLNQFERLELVEAFKIENSLLLASFEHKLQKSKDSFLKGLFVVMSKKQLLQLCLFGFKPLQHQTSEYRQKYLRIPPSYIKNNQSVIEKMLVDAQAGRSKETPLKAYMSSTNQEVKHKLYAAENKQKDKLLCLVLCRVIVVNQNAEGSETFLNSKLGYYDINDSDHLYPEYVMLIKPVRNFNKSKNPDYFGQINDNLKTIDKQIKETKATIKSKINDFWNKVNIDVCKKLSSLQLRDRDISVKQHLQKQLQELKSIHEKENQNLEELKQTKQLRITNSNQ